MNLFDSIPLEELPGTPLAERSRPKELKDLLGQPAVVQQVLRWLQVPKGDTKVAVPSLLFYGPPGTGKTSLARILGEKSGALFRTLNATSSSVKDLREVADEGRNLRRTQGRRLMVFVDEIHRFSKSQQEVLLPFIETGDLWLVGATTENPRVSLTTALLSRLRVLTFKRLETATLEELVGHNFPQFRQQLSQEAFAELLSWADGDARKLLGAVEVLQLEIESNSALEIPLTKESLLEILGEFFLRHDRSGDVHYELASALIKSLRGSDPDAALYYLARLIEGGEDPDFISRRLMIFASEDVGNADPRALSLAVSGAQAVDKLGWPEGRIVLAQVVTYLSSCPKSNRSYRAINEAQAFVKKTGSLSIPEHLKNHSPKYKYPHDFPRSYVDQRYFPDLPESASPPTFYQPGPIGQEKALGEYLQWIRTGKTLTNSAKD